MVNCMLLPDGSGMQTETMTGTRDIRAISLSLRQVLTGNSRNTATTFLLMVSFLTRLPVTILSALIIAQGYDSCGHSVFTPGTCKRWQEAAGEILMVELEDSNHSFTGLVQGAWVLDGMKHLALRLANWYGNGNRTLTRRVYGMRNPESFEKLHRDPRVLHPDTRSRSGPRQ